jgi:hypothetical protein
MALELTGKSVRFFQQLTAGVAMTSNVKGREQLFLGLHHGVHLGACKEAEPGRDDG